MTVGTWPSLRSSRGACIGHDAVQRPLDAEIQRQRRRIDGWERIGQVDGPGGGGGEIDLVDVGLGEAVEHARGGAIERHRDVERARSLGVRQGFAWTGTPLSSAFDAGDRAELALTSTCNKGLVALFWVGSTKKPFVLSSPEEEIELECELDVYGLIPDRHGE